MSFLQVYKSTAAVGLSVNSNPGAHISMEIVLAHLTLLHRSGHHRVQDLQSTRAGVDHFGTCWVICLLQHKNLEATSTCGCSAQPTDKQQPFLPLCLLLSDFIERFIICGRSGERSRFANQRQEKSPQYPSGLSVRSYSLHKDGCLWCLCVQWLSLQRGAAREADLYVQNCCCYLDLG
ncbi:hypothetical protein GN956_G2052 [Arapaima gigas]